MKDFGFLQHAGPIAVAHRGGMAEAAENSIEAFAKTVDLGYRYIETDVRATADGKLYTWHGPPDREHDESPLDLRSLPSKEGASLPLLADVLRAFPDVKFCIDPKHWLAVEPLVAVIAKAKAVKRVCIGSFSEARILAVKQGLWERTGEEVCTAMGPRGILGLYARSMLIPWCAWRSSYPSVLPPLNQFGLSVTTRRFIRAAHKGGVKVIPWTVNERADMIRLLDYGVDGIITDFPSRLKEVLVERGQWVER